MVKYAWCLFLLAVMPAGGWAVTFWGLQLQPAECIDTRLHFKLLLWGPVVEELVFRAGIQKGLIRHRVGPLQANCIASVLFALAHFALSGNPATLAVLAPSLLLGWTYQKTDSLAWTILLHSGLNLLLLGGVCWI
jgi:membrane protease YdiL (CAAX protease family)